MTLLRDQTETDAASVSAPPEDPSAVAEEQAAPGVAPDRRPARRAYALLVASHTITDVYPQFIFSLAVALKGSLALGESQLKWLFAITPICSGLSQPLFAWLGDRWNTRAFGPLGLGVGAVCMSMIGFAENFWQLIALQIVGMIGIGVYHPIGSALAGTLGASALAKPNGRRSARSLGISIFFTAGMIGGFAGPLVANGFNLRADGVLGVAGMRWLGVMMVPGLLLAGAIWLATRHVQHRAPSPRAEAGPLEDALVSESERRRRRTGVTLLTICNALRFTTNIALFYLFARLAEVRIPDAPDLASALHGHALSASQLGMGVTGLLAGWFVTAGRERGPMLLSSLLATPAILLMPWLEGWGLLAAAFVAAVGYFGVIPISIALAQRLLPHATGAAGSLMMGIGWAISALGPVYARAIEQWVGQATGDEALALRAAFFGVAGLILLSGLLSLLLSPSLLRETAHND